MIGKGARRPKQDQIRGKLVGVFGPPPSCIGPYLHTSLNVARYKESKSPNDEIGAPMRSKYPI